MFENFWKKKKKDVYSEAWMGGVWWGNIYEADKTFLTDYIIYFSLYSTRENSECNYILVLYGLNF